MIQFGDLPDTVPIFPLPGALLLPRARLPLHVFEPRYLQMLDDVLKSNNRIIGMVQPFEGADATDRLHQIGCSGRVTSFTETDDGRYMITLSGAARFRLGDEVVGFTPYRRFQVDWRGFERDIGLPEHDPDWDRAPFLETLSRFFEAENLSADWNDLAAADDELLINSLSMLCPFSPEDKQALLEAPSLVTRRETLATLIAYALSGGADSEMLQ